MLVWLFVSFVSFGLFAPRNALVVIALLIGALSIAGAVDLIVDMDQPFEAMIVVSAEPMQEALAQMNPGDSPHHPILCAGSAVLTALRPQLDGDEVGQRPFWSDFKASDTRRNHIVHGGLTVVDVDTQKSVDAANRLAAHLPR